MKWLLCLTLISIVSVCRGQSMTAYYYQNSGDRCPDANRITALDTCKNAYIALDYGTKSWYQSVMGGYYGDSVAWDCSVYGYGFFQYNYMPTSSSSTCSVDKPCVCKIVVSATCEHNDGSAVNSDSCICGDVVCTDAMDGLRCTESTSSCTRYPPCSNTDGSVDNGVPCQCGTTACGGDGSVDNKYYCSLASSYCGGEQASHVGDKWVAPMQTTAGTCPSGGATDVQGCQAAFDSDYYRNWGTKGIWMSMSDIYAHESGWDDLPPGCSVQRLDQRMFFNHDPSRPGRCTPGQDYWCICREDIYGETCYNGDGRIATTRECECGSSVCSIGDYCNPRLPVNKCASFPTCPNRDGSVVVTERCSCNANTCHSGKYCKWDSPGTSTCKATPVCQNSNGLNSVACSCGDLEAQCDAGEYCTASTSICAPTSGGYVKNYHLKYFPADDPFGKNSCLPGKDIENGRECEAAAVHMGTYLSDYVFSAAQKLTIARGCYQKKTDGVMFYNDDEGGLEPCTNNYPCVCKSITPRCANVDGSVENTEDCVCRDEMCTATKGHYCTDTLAADSYIKINTPCDPDIRQYNIQTADVCVTAFDSFDFPQEYSANIIGCSGCGMPSANKPPACHMRADGMWFYNSDHTATSCDGGCVCRLPGGWCNTVPHCIHTDGITANTVDCACGTSDCSGYPRKRFCLASESLCTAGPPCDNTDGTVVNVNTCVCGLGSCDGAQGYYCYKAANQCAWESGVVFHEGPSGYSPLCPNTDGTQSNKVTIDCFCVLDPDDIADEHLCRKRRFSNQHMSDASYCKLDRAADSYTGAGTTQKDVVTRCNEYEICTILDGQSVTTMTPTSGSISCHCGNALCEAWYEGGDQGEFCKADENRCEDSKICLNRDGTVENDGPCLCGASTTCSSDSGYYCYGTHSICGKLGGLSPRTVSGDTDFECFVSAKNNYRCFCGDEYCEESLYCEINDLPDYKMITTGKCDDDPTFEGVSSSNCASAIDVLLPGWHGHFTTASDRERPPGCVVSSSSSSSPPQYYHNTPPSGSTIAPATNQYKVICKRRFRELGKRGCHGCIHLDGLTTNTDDCWCGDVQCNGVTGNNGRYCNVVLGQCTNGVFSKYTYLVSGPASDCSVYPGWSKINTVSGCKDAILDLDVGSIVNQISLDTKPNGCFVYQGTTAYLNSCLDCPSPDSVNCGGHRAANCGACIDDAPLIYRSGWCNPAGPGDGECRWDDAADLCYKPDAAPMVPPPPDCSPDNKCVCVASGQQCVHQDGATVNSGTNCWCSNTLCTSGLTGMICSNGQCSRPAVCSSVDGYTATNSVCACGNFDCAASDFCRSDVSKCNSIRRCDSVDGSARNSAECVCGTSVCGAQQSGGSGLRCNEMANLCFMKTCDPGAQIQTENCLCGSGNTYCPSDSYCWTSRSQVNTHGVFSLYAPIFAGSCTDDPDGSFIRSGSECNGQFEDLQIFCEDEDCEESPPQYEFQPTPPGQGWYNYGGLVAQNVRLHRGPACWVSPTTMIYYFNPYENVLAQNCGLDDTICMCRYTQYPQCGTDINSPSNAPCQCGTAHCHEGTVFCDAANSKCLLHKPCTVTDHSLTNQEECSCGYNQVQYKKWTNFLYTINQVRLCPAHFYCDLNGHGCHEIPKCASTDGTQVHGVYQTSCVCGTANCEYGQYCNGDVNTCFNYAPCQYTTNSNTNPGGCICGSEQCKMYGLWLGTGLVCDNGACSRPPTCNYYDAEQAVGEICQCGNVDCGIGEFCYAATSECKSHGYCSNTDGTMANPACRCGSADCRIQSPYCHSNICLTYPKCPNTVGTIANPDLCRCNSVACDATSGQFCDFDNSRCRQGPPCSSIDGHLNNPDICACGTTDCIPGQYEYKIRSYVETCVETQNGWGYVESAADCAIAGSALGISAAVQVRSNEEHLHIGCVYNHINQLYWIPTSVGNFDCGWGKHNCICKRSIGNYCEADNNRCRPGPPCPRSNGLLANTEVCACAGQDCPVSKLFCNKAEEKCRVGPLCNDPDGTVLTNQACACGSTSDCGVGEFCYESQDKCKPYTLCETTDGSAPNSGECSCGAVDCSASSGLYCNLATETCGQIARCPNNKGLVANAQECQCGHVRCDSQYGFFCYEDQSLCSDSTDFILPHIRDHWSGCTGELRRITTDAECAQVVPALWLRYDTEHKRNWYKDVTYNYAGAQSVRPQFEPYGCGLQSYGDSNPRDVVMWIGSSGAQCNSYERPCICGLDTRACQDRSGTVVETLSCMCGTAFCTAPGQVCNAATNTCEYPACQDPTGHSPQLSDYDGCMCNGASCNSETGLYCNADYSTQKCRATPRCLNVDGTVENTQDCACGTSDCSYGIGHYCREDLGVCFKTAGCVNTDGLTVNSAACQCGLQQCAPKQLCSEDSSECSFPECSEIDGFLANSDTCDCGGEVCSQENTYQYIGSGTCWPLLYINGVSGSQWTEPSTSRNEDKLLECMNICIALGDNQLARATAFVLSSTGACACSTGACASRTTGETRSYHIIHGQDGGLHCSKIRKQCSLTNIFTAYKTMGDGCPLNVQPWSTDCPDYCVPGSGCVDSEGFSPLSEAECQIASAQWMVSDIFGVPALKYGGNYINTDTSGSTASWKARGCTKSVYESAAYYRELDAECKSTSLCVCKEEDRCIFSKEMPICTQRNGYVINDSPCICGRTSCTSVSGLYCSIETETCAPVPFCTQIQGLLENSGSCLCSVTTVYVDPNTGLVDPDKIVLLGSVCASNELFCQLEQNDCRSYAKCTNVQGTVTHPERCACGTADCLAHQLCTHYVQTRTSEEQSLCEYPLCANTNGLSPNPPCLCAGNVCNADTFCMSDKSLQCENLRACDTEDGTQKTDAQCVCASTTRHEECLPTQHCNKDLQSQCYYEDCSQTSGMIANTFVCACGSTDCLVASPFCNLAEGRCQTKPLCPLVNGQIANIADCDCGGVVCGASHRFCQQDQSECRSQRRCLETGGDVPNGLSCQCGEDGEECSSSNPYCTEQFKSCAPIPNVTYDLFYTGFWIQVNQQGVTPMSKTTKTSASSVTISYASSCETAGLQQISDMNECQTGSGLVWDYTDFYIRDWENLWRFSQYDVAQCVMDRFHTNVYYGGTVGGGTVCGENGLNDHSQAVDRSGDICICKALWHSCYHGDNLVTQDTACTCGDVRCEAGQLCDRDSSTCKWPDCDHTDGFVENVGIPYSKCTCGNSVCTGETGLFCQGDISTCSEYTKCQKSNGTELNLGTCACSTTTCTAAGGLYCFYDLEQCFPYGICPDGDRLAANPLDCQCVRDGFIATAGSTSICSFRNPYCSNVDGKCYEPPCQSNTGKIREVVSCICSYELKTNSTGLYTPALKICSGSRGQDESTTPAVLQHPFCDHTNGKTATPSYCYCLDDSTLCTAGQYCSGDLGHPFCTEAPTCDNLVDFDGVCSCRMDWTDCEYDRTKPAYLQNPICYNTNTYGQRNSGYTHRLYSNTDVVEADIKLTPGVKYKVSFSVIRMASGAGNQMDSLYLDNKNFGGCDPPFTSSTDCSWAACHPHTIFPVQKREYFTPYTDTVHITASFSGDVYPCYCNREYDKNAQCSNSAGYYGSLVERGILITFIPWLAPVGDTTANMFTNVQYLASDAQDPYYGLPLHSANVGKSTECTNKVCDRSLYRINQGQYCYSSGILWPFDFNTYKTVPSVAACFTDCIGSSKHSNWYSEHPAVFSGSIHMKRDASGEFTLCACCKERVGLLGTSFLRPVGTTDSEYNTYSLINEQETCRLPFCPDQNRLTVNPKDCICGDTECNDATGRICGIQNSHGNCGSPRCHNLVASANIEQTCECSPSPDVYGPTCLLGSLRTRCFYPSNSDFCDPAHASFVTNCGCTDLLTFECRYAEGKIRNIETCACGGTACAAGEYCNAQYSQCNLQVKIPSCHYFSGLEVNPQSCLCGTSLCGDGGYFCNPGRQQRTECFKKLCSTYDDADALCDAQGFGNGLLAEAQCQSTTCGENDRSTCCRPCDSGFQVFDGKCRQQCIYTIDGQPMCDIQNGTIPPPTSVPMGINIPREEYISSLNKFWTGYCDTNECKLTDQNTCCVPAPKCDTQDPQTLCTGTIYTGTLIQNNFCQGTVCTPESCCHQRTCICEGGAPAKGTLCPDPTVHRCVSCEQGRWLSETRCLNASTCGPKQWQFKELEANANRICYDVRECDPLIQYESEPPTNTSNRECQTLKKCQWDEFQTVAPTNVSDRQCQTLRPCSVTEFQTVAPTNVSDRQCAPFGHPCLTNTEFQTVAPTNVSNRQCQNITTCATTQFQLMPPTNVSNRQCQNITTCATTQFQLMPPTNVSNRQCQNITTCSTTQFQTIAPTTTSNRQCQDIKTCSTTQFQTIAPTNVSNRQCQDIKTCSVTEYGFVAPTNVSDRQCTTCSNDELECLGCITETDCEFNPMSKVIDQNKCSSLTCDRIIVSEQTIEPILKVYYWYRFEGNYTLTAPNKVSKANYQYFQVQSIDDVILLNGNSLKIQQDCLFADYIWQGCLMKCGNVTEIAFRGSKLQEAKHGGAPCEDVPEIIYRSCEGTACPVDCVVQWDTDFGECSAECGASGLQYRNYTILQDTLYRGQQCPNIQKRGCVGSPAPGLCDCSGATLDICDVCGGDGKSCRGCDGQPNSGKIWNRCGKCAMPGEPCSLKSKMKLKEKQRKSRSSIIVVAIPLITATVFIIGLVLLYVFCADKQQEKQEKQEKQGKQEKQRKQEKQGKQEKQRKLRL